MTKQSNNATEQSIHLAQKIRRLAAKNDLVARKSRNDGNWYFSDFNNYLRSPEQGLHDQEALEFLAQQ